MSQNENPRIPYPEYTEQTQPGTIDRSQRRGTRTAGRLAATALAVGLAGNALVQGSHILDSDKAAPQPTPEYISVSIDQIPNRAAVEAIAQRYDCSIESVVDSQTPPTEDPGGYGDLQNRSTVMVNLAVPDSAEAAPYLEQFKDVNTVQWEGGAHVKAVLQEPGEPGFRPVADDPIPSTVGYQVTDGQTQAAFFPKHTYADGTVMTVVIQNEVNTHDEDYRYTAYGEQVCGSLVLQNEVWTVAPENVMPLVQPSVSQDVVGTPLHN